MARGKTVLGYGNSDPRNLDAKGQPIDDSWVFNKNKAATEYWTMNRIAGELHRKKSD